jgi:sulfite reductase (NADPH) hemoprotein beta-component
MNDANASRAPHTLANSGEAHQPPSKNEGIKERSRALRGSIDDGLATTTTGQIAEDDTQLIKFHGMYQQDDRDLRGERRRKKLEPAFSFMARVRIPGGVLTPAQWLALDGIGATYANNTLRITTRQTIQFHGLLKFNVRASMAAMDAVLLDTIAACGDVNRNVMCNPNPSLSAAHAEALELARAISAHLLPRSRAWHEIWLNGEKTAGGEVEEDPIYLTHYLPRKFKIGVAVPPENDVDLFSQDLGFAAVIENNKVIGWNVVAGGGMGMTHGQPDTFPRAADVLGFCTPDQAVKVAEAVLTAQRDFGNRSDRHHARLKYTIETHGLDWLLNEVTRRAGFALQPARDIIFTRTGDRYGWTKDAGGNWHFCLFVENGRLWGAALDGLRAIAQLHDGEFRLTPNQNVIISNVKPNRKARIAALLSAHGLDEQKSGLRRNAVACVGLPSCGLSLAESERELPHLITELEAELEKNGLREDEIVIRMTGCPNGCARPYLAEIGLVGRTPGIYHLYLGAAFEGTRLNKLYRRDVDRAGIVASLAPLFAAYAGERRKGERFGDFVIRAGHVRPTLAGNQFHADVDPVA